MLIVHAQKLDICGSIAALISLKRNPSSYIAGGRLITNLLSVSIGGKIDKSEKIEKGNTVKGFIVEWFEGCWLTWGFSDPSRTLVVENALVLETKEDAEKYLERAKKRNPHRSFDKARVIQNPTSNPIEEKETEYCYWCGADIEDAVVHDGEHYCSNECSRWE